MKIEAFAWHATDGHDKVWGYFSLGDKFYSFWGRRGKKLAFKEHEGYSERQLETKFRKKIREGYVEVPMEMVETMTPGFSEEFETNFAIAQICDSFHGSPGYGKFG